MTDFVPDDLDTPIYGAEAFAKILNRTERQVYDDLEKKRLDGYAKKWGLGKHTTPFAGQPRT